MVSDLSKLSIVVSVLLAVGGCSDKDTNVYELDTPKKDKEYVQHLTNFNYKLPGGQKLHISTDYDFDIDENMSGDKWISASPCVDAETFKMIYDKDPDLIHNILNENKNEIITNIIGCMERLKKAKVSNFKLEFSDITIKK